MQIGDRVQYRGAGEFAELGWGLVLGIEPDTHTLRGTTLWTIELLWHDGTIRKTFAHQLRHVDDTDESIVGF